MGRGRGEAMTTERVSLYGLPIVTGRRGRGRPRSIRRGPGRCSCATRWSTATGTARGTPSSRANQERVADVVALEQRVRRDLLVGDDALVAFFDERVPGRRRHRRAASTPGGSEVERDEPDRLTYQPSDLIDPSAGVPDLADFPETLAPRRRAAAAHLRARPRRPTSTAWWSTCRCRCSTPSGAPGSTGRCPGRRLELVTALIRTLPKDLRRRHTPAGEAAAERARADRARGRPAARGPRRALTERGGPTVAPAPPRPGRGARPPAGHLPRRRRRRPAARLEQGPRRPAPPARRARPRRAGGRRRPSTRSHGATVVGVRHHPRHRRRSTHAGHAVTGHPALVDEGDTVGLRVLPTEAEARDGDVGRHPPPPAAAARLAAAHARPSPARRHQAGARRLRRAPRRPRSTASARRRPSTSSSSPHGGPVRDEAGVRGAARSRARRRSPAAAVRLAELVAEAARARGARSMRRSRRCSPPAHDETVLDVAAPPRPAAPAAAGSPTPATTSCPTWCATSAPSSTACRRPRTEPDRDRRRIAGDPAARARVPARSRPGTPPARCARCSRSSASAPSPSRSAPRAASARPRSAGPRALA